MEAVVLQRVGFLEYFCPKQGQDFKPSVALNNPNMGQSPPPSGFISRQRALVEYLLNSLLFSVKVIVEIYFLFQGVLPAETLCQRSFQ